MNAISYYDELLAITKNHQKFSLTEKELTVTEKNSISKIDLNSISNVRIIKCRELFINYFLVVLILMGAHFLSRLVENNFVLNSIILIAILASFSIKKYSHTVLINTNNLNFKKFKIVTKNAKTNQRFLTMTRINFNHLSWKIPSRT
jgi:hypothetical protein